MSANENETIAGISEELRRLSDTAKDGIIAVKGNAIADRIEAAWKREREEYREAATSEMLKGATIIDNRSIGNAIINTWKYPLTNLGHRGNQNRGPKTPVAIVRDAEGCVLMTSPGEPYRTNEEAIAKASEFCAAMNELHERVGNATTTGNAAAMREALVQCELFLGNVIRHGHPTLNPGDKCTACEGADELRGMVCRALSEPPRNCDIGTAEERLHRYHELCREISERHERIGERAPLTAFPTAFEWEDRPYEEGGAS